MEPPGPGHARPAFRAPEGVKKLGSGPSFLEDPQGPVLCFLRVSLRFLGTTFLYHEDGAGRALASQ